MTFPRWVRRVCFGKARGVCENCGRKWDNGYMLYAHHRKPSCEGGADTEENCEMLCRDCHAKRHQHLADYYRRTGNKKLQSANAYAVRTIKKHHNLMRLNWNG